MRGVIEAIQPLAPDEGWTYSELAAHIYGTGEPARAHLSAIGRSVMALAAKQQVLVTAGFRLSGDDWDDDERFRVVGAPRHLVDLRLAAWCYDTDSPTPEEISTARRFRLGRHASRDGNRLTREDKDFIRRHGLEAGFRALWAMSEGWLRPASVRPPAERSRLFHWWFATAAGTQP